MLDATSATVSGDPTCAEPTYFSVVNGEVITSPDILSVLRERHRSGREIELNPIAISHLLHDGFVPQPDTVYKDVFALSSGMSATVSHGRVSFALDFPFAKIRSRQDSDPAPDKLLHLLAAATAKACGHHPGPLLMLSAGLDSTSLALAAKEAGRDDIVCITYAEPDDHDEAILARGVCKRLGLRHETYCLDLTSDAVCRILLSYAAMAPEPCADPALTACVAPIASHAGQDTVILDGSGNDAYFWKPPRQLDIAKLHLSVNRVPAVRYMRGLFPMHLRYERLLSSPLELLLFAGPRLRYCDTRHFYRAAIDTQRSWLDRLNWLAMPAEEIRSSVRAAFMGPAAHMMKTRNAANAAGATARFPWADHSVANHCFNLPEQHRFDRPSQKNKVILREMLGRYLDYDEAGIGKRVFKFSKRLFLEAHLPFCRDQVLSCSLWEPTIEYTFERLAGRFLRGARTENGLLTLLMVSLWHNHWVRTELPRVVRSTSAEGVAA